MSAFFSFVMNSNKFAFRQALYERQILATLKHLVNQLERHQARRLGQPVAAPVALDVTRGSRKRELENGQ